MISVNFVKLRSGAREPLYATAGSAAADLFACLDDISELDGLIVENGTVTIDAGARVSIPIGIAIEPVIGDAACANAADSFVALMFGRSGNGTKFGVTLANSVGVIDSDYRGEIRATLINQGAQPFTVAHGDRVAQLAFVPVATARFTLAQSLGETERGAGGFGSTGR